MQSKNGCFTELAKPVATYAGKDYTRCPRTYVQATEMRILEARGGQLLREMTHRERMRLPAKYVEAILFIDDLLVKRVKEALPNG